MRYKKAIPSCRITCERSEIAGERRTALYKSDKQAQILTQRSGAVWKSRWTSWAPVTNKPTVSVDVRQHSTNGYSLDDERRDAWWHLHVVQDAGQPGQLLCHLTDHRQ